MNDPDTLNICSLPPATLKNVLLDIKRAPKQRDLVRNFTTVNKFTYNKALKQARRVVAYKEPKIGKQFGRKSNRIGDDPESDEMFTNENDNDLSLGEDEMLGEEDESDEDDGMYEENGPIASGSHVE